MRKVLPPLFLVLAILLVGCGSKNPSSTTAGGAAGGPAATIQPSSTSNSGITIAVIPKGTTHDYWKSVQAGAEAAGNEEKVQIDWKGPLQEDDRAGQIQIVQNFVADNVSGIVI